MHVKLKAHRMAIATIQELLDLAKKIRGLPSDAQLARALDVSGASVSALRKGHNTLDDATALRLAELLDLDPSFVFACNRAAGAKTPGVKQVWEDLAKRLAAGLLGALALLASWGAPPPDQAAVIAHKG